MSGRGARFKGVTVTSVLLVGRVTVMGTATPRTSGILVMWAPCLAAPVTALVIMMSALVAHSVITVW